MIGSKRAVCLDRLYIRAPHERHRARRGLLRRARRLDRSGSAGHARPPVAAVRRQNGRQPPPNRRQQRPLGSLRLGRKGRAHDGGYPPTRCANAATSKRAVSSGWGRTRASCRSGTRFRAVDDCNATIERAKLLGSSTEFVHIVPKHGRVGSLHDPGGAVFAIRGPVP